VTEKDCKHNASMPNILVRDLPEDVHAELLRRAERAGQSLQQYLTSELTRLAATPTLDEVLARIRRRRGGARVGLKEAVEALDAERAARDRD
jgi:antitoxin FitA